jgi:glycerate 2-kinase
VNAARSPKTMHLAPKTVLKALLQAALDRADPLHQVARHLPSPPRGRTLVVGAGKASARMALALERAWPGPLEGLVVTRYGHGEPCERIKVVQAAHPVPDAAGESAARHMLKMVQGLSADDLVIALISGGGSSLITLPREGLTLDHLQRLNAELLASGAPIQDINAVRRDLSAIKGGRLARACGQAHVCTLVLSDVPDDDPAVVASGPTVEPRGAGEPALQILRRYGIKPEVDVLRALQQPAESLARSAGPRDVHVIATAQEALDAAATAARDMGLGVLMLGSRIEGEAREVGRVHAGIALHCLREGKPMVVLSGGETTVTLRASRTGVGRGGRNTDFLLGFATALAGAQGAHAVHAIACDTDGIDGTEDNAGAVADGTSVARAAALGVDANEHLQRHDPYTFFAALGDLVITGPTRTNVNDFRAVLVWPQSPATAYGARTP